MRLHDMNELAQQRGERGSHQLGTAGIEVHHRRCKHLRIATLVYNTA